MTHKNWWQEKHPSIDCFKHSHVALPMQCDHLIEENEMNAETNIPEGIYWSREAGNLYDETTNTGMGWAFYDTWKDRHEEFPEKVTTVPELNLDLDLDSHVRVIAMPSSKQSHG